MIAGRFRAFAPDLWVVENDVFGVGTDSKGVATGFWREEMLLRESATLLRGVETRFAGDKTVFAGIETVFAARKSVFAGSETMFAAKKSVFAGTETMFAAIKTMFVASETVLRRGKSVFVGNETMFIADCTVIAVSGYAWRISEEKVGQIGAINGSAEGLKGQSVEAGAQGVGGRCRVELGRISHEGAPLEAG